MVIAPTISQNAFLRYIIIFSPIYSVGSPFTFESNWSNSFFRRPIYSSSVGFSTGPLLVISIIIKSNNIMNLFLSTNQI